MTGNFLQGGTDVSGAVDSNLFLQIKAKFSLQLLDNRQQGL